MGRFVYNYFVKALAIGKIYIVEEIFSRNYEANASEFLENLGRKKFSSIFRYYIPIDVFGNHGI